MIKSAIFFESHEEHDEFMRLYRLGKSIEGQPASHTEGIEVESENPFAVPGRPTWVPEDPPNDPPEKTGWRPVNAWDGTKDPTETRPGKYRQTFNEDGTPGAIEFLPEGEEG